jgi:hypothetical protein
MDDLHNPKFPKSNSARWTRSQLILKGSKPIWVWDPAAPPQQYRPLFDVALRAFSKQFSLAEIAHVFESGFNEFLGVLYGFGGG